MKNLQEILELHKKWLNNNGGRHANLQGADLRDVDLRHANLQDANLQDANLQYANLQYANLRGADLRGADLQYANLQYANLWGADLQYANLRDVDLRHANLQDANLQDANLRDALGDRNRIHTLQLQGYTVNILDCEILQIGCKKYALEEWKSFTDAEIEEMGVGVLEWWKKHKDFIFMYVDILRGD